MDVKCNVVTSGRANLNGSLCPLEAKSDEDIRAVFDGCNLISPAAGDLERRVVGSCNAFLYLVSGGDTVAVHVFVVELGIYYESVFLLSGVATVPEVKNGAFIFTDGVSAMEMECDRYGCMLDNDEFLVGVLEAPQV